MLKKSLFVGAGLLVLAGLFFGRDACSYLGTSINQARESFKDSVPVQFELERARQMVKGLEPEIRRNEHEIAKEDVQVERLEAQVQSKETNLAQARKEILQLKGDLMSGGSSYVYAGESYTEAQVKADLKSRFEAYKTDEATTANLRKILNVRKSGLTAARQKLTEMRNAREQLKLEIANLESRQKMVEVAQTASDYNFDDSKLARTKELISEIGVRIKVAEKMVDVKPSSADRIPVGEEAKTDDADITGQVADYFGKGEVKAEEYVASE